METLLCLLVTNLLLTTNKKEIKKKDQDGGFSPANIEITPYIQGYSFPITGSVKFFRSVYPIIENAFYQFNRSDFYEENVIELDIRDPKLDVFIISQREGYICGPLINNRFTIDFFRRNNPDKFTFSITKDPYCYTIGVVPMYLVVIKRNENVSWNRYRAEMLLNQLPIYYNINVDRLTIMNFLNNLDEIL